MSILTIHLCPEPGTAGAQLSVMATCLDAPVTLLISDAFHLGYLPIYPFPSIEPELQEDKDVSGPFPFPFSPSPSPLPRNPTPPSLDLGIPTVLMGRQ